MTKLEESLLPHEVGIKSDGRNLIFCAMGVLALLITANFGARAYLRRDTPNSGYRVIREKWGILNSINAPVDILVLGDSSCNQGVIPSILKEKLGLSAVNLCTMGDMLAINDAWMLNTYIRRMGPPKIVLMVHVYGMWKRHIGSNFLAATGQIPESWNELQPSPSIGASGYIRLFLAKYVPLFSEQASLAKKIKFWDPRPPGLTLEADGYERTPNPDPSAVLNDEQILLPEVREGKFYLSAENRLALDDIAKLQRRYGFKVYIANSPLYDGLIINPYFQKYLSTIEKELLQWTSQVPGSFYIFRQPMGFPKEEMQNICHLVDSGARRYTAALADELARTGFQKRPNRPHSDR